MLNYEEELRKFKPSLEVDQIEEAVYKEDLTDMQGAATLQSGARELADGMEKFDREGTSKLKSTVEDELGDVLDRFDALTSDDCTYTTFSGKDSGMEGNVKFVIETEAIE